MDNSSAVQALGLILAITMAMFLYLDHRNSSSKAWKIAAFVALLFGSPGAIHMLFAMYRNIL